MRERPAARHVFVDGTIPEDGPFSIVGPTHHHMAAVVRVRPGDALILRDSDGGASAGEVVEVRRRELVVRVVGPAPSPPAPPCRITVAQAPGKGDRFERVLQHGAEIGVERFVPLISDRTVPEWSHHGIEAKMDRWRLVLTSAAEQSRRDRVPRVLPPHAPIEAARVLQADAALMLLDASGPPMLRPGALPSSDSYAVFVGPEGGFSASEKSDLISAVCSPVSLGPYVLRTETAALAASAILIALAAARD